MAALLDWLCARIAKAGEWLIKKTQERKKSTSMMTTWLNKNSTLFAETNS